MDEWLKCLQKTDYPHENIHLAWLVNNSTDKTYEILKDFKRDHESEYRQIDIWTANGNWRDNRYAGRFFSYFSLLRNLFLSMRTPEDDYILSLDSDILILPDTVSTLLKHNLPVVAGLIPNGPIQAGYLAGQMSYNFMECMKRDEDGRTYYLHRDINYLIYKEFEQSDGVCPRDNQLWDLSTGIYTSCKRFSGPVPVDMTGAVFAIRKDVLDTPGVEFGHHWQGEDCYFCERVQEAGFKCYLDRFVIPAHILGPEMLEDYKQHEEHRKDYGLLPMPARSFHEPKDVPPKIELVKKE